MLEEDVLPVLSGLLNRAAFIDAAREKSFSSRRSTVSEHGSFKAGASRELILLADQGPSYALDTAMTSVENDGRHDPGLLVWARQRLEEIGVSNDGWRATARVPCDRLDAMLTEFVTPVLADVGFARTERGYCHTSDRGALALIDVTLSAAASAEKVVFYLDMGLLSADDRSAAQPPSARYGSLFQPIAPPADHATALLPALRRLGFRPWSFTDPKSAAQCGRGIARTLTDTTVPYQRESYKK